jgi:hypothetical protein
MAPFGTDAVDLSVRLDRIKRLADELAKTRADSVEARQLAEQIKREVDVIREFVRPAETN